MDCPRCHLPLTKADYEGVETDMCTQCWGFWLDTGELELVLNSQQFDFSDDEKGVVLDLLEASIGGRIDPAPCPKCGKRMSLACYDESVRLVLDRCDEHGVWLDTGELKKVQALAEKSEKVHRLLLRKLGLLS